LQSQKYSSLTFAPFVSIFTLLLLLLLILFSYSPHHKAFAVSPAFDQIFITDAQWGKNDWVQTHGNDSSHLKSDYANLLAVDYLSDGKTLDATLWLKSTIENASTYNQPFKKIRYGMLIAIVSLPPTSGYNGANYNYYIEAVNGKWSEYLYELSATGASELIKSKINYTEPFGGPTLGPGYVHLRLDLGSINYPSAYGLSFYTAESFKSNEVRDFTTWIAIPPATIHVLTHPKNIVIRQGETQLIPAEMETPYSKNVSSITFDKHTDFSSAGSHVSTQTIHPPSFKVEVSPQTPVGVYNIPFVASMLIATTYTSSLISAPATATVDRATEVVDPEFQVSKKYPTIGYATGPANLTINVIPPLTLNETFTAFWATYGNEVALIASGAVGAFSAIFVDYVKDRKEHKKNISTRKNIVEE
jgi:hypothetical protein